MNEIGRTLPIKEYIRTNLAPNINIKCSNVDEKQVVYDCYEANPLQIGTSGQLSCHKKGVVKI